MVDHFASFCNINDEDLNRNVLDFRTLEDLYCNNIFIMGELNHALNVTRNLALGNDGVMNKFLKALLSIYNSTR